MTRWGKRSLALLGAAALGTLAWPGPSAADTSLGGYSGTAMAQAIRIQIFEPVIPIPANPQVDGGIGYAKSTTDTGPVSRATASYLWPGDVVGDGFGQLAGNDKAQYWIQVNSRYPATASSPEHNTAQVTDGNGMTTSSDGFTTKATVTGLGIAGPDTDLLSGIGEGLRNLGGATSASAAPTPQAPVPVGQLLAALATVENVKSTSLVEVAGKTVTSTASTFMSELKLLDGLITIDDLKATCTTESDGKKATTTGRIQAGSVSIAGQEFGFGDKGLALGGSSTPLPDVPDSVTELLQKIGISVQFAPSAKTVDGASGSLASTALVLSIDTQPLKTALNLGGLVKPLQDMLQQIPNIGSQLAGVLGLGPKIVFRIADVTSSATASPAYTGPVIPPTGGSPGVNPNPGTGPAVNQPGGGGVPIDQGSGLPGTGPVDQGGSTTPSTTQPAAFQLPGLGTIPKMIILGGLVLAAACGWLFRAVGGFILGAGRACSYGLSTGVPDLRKG